MTNLVKIHSILKCIRRDIDALKGLLANTAWTFGEILCNLARTEALKRWAIVLREQMAANMYEENTRDLMCGA